MIDEKTGSELVTVNTSAGERHLKRLAPADWVKLSNTLRATRKAELRAELGASAAARTQAINACLVGVREKLKAAPQDKAERMIQDALASALDATEAEARKRLDEFDRRPIKYRDVESFINTMEGQYAAILYSACRKTTRTRARPSLTNWPCRRRIGSTLPGGCSTCRSWSRG
jgi:hypothetical protein